MVADTRPLLLPESHELTGLSPRILELCDTARTVTALLRDGRLASNEAEVRNALETLVADRLMLAIEGVGMHCTLSSRGGWLSSVGCRFRLGREREHSAVSCPILGSLWCEARSLTRSSGHGV